MKREAFNDPSDVWMFYTSLRCYETSLHDERDLMHDSQRIHVKESSRYLDALVQLAPVRELYLA